MLDLVLNADGVDGEPSKLIPRFLFEQVLFRIGGSGRIERREPERFFYVDGKHGMAIEIDTDEGDRFGSIYISVTDANPPEAARRALALAGFLAGEIGLKVINPVEGIRYAQDALPELA